MARQGSLLAGSREGKTKPKQKGRQDRNMNLNAKEEPTQRG